MSLTGLDFAAIQVRDLARSEAFYTEQLGLTRAPDGPPHAVVFATKPIPFAVREPLPGVDLEEAKPAPGVGVALWFLAEDSQRLHDELEAAGVPIVQAPEDGPFGRTFTLRDPDGYLITVHDRA